ncbi:MAG: DUF927 domain-containing protein [Methanosarcina sp.]
MPSLAEILVSAAKFNSIEDMEEFVYSEHDNLLPEEQVSQEELENFVAGIASAIESQSTVFNYEYMDSILEKEEVPENKEDKLEAAYKFSRANIARYDPDETAIYISTHIKKHFKLTATETNSIIKVIKRENKNFKKQSFTQVSAIKESGVKYGDSINSEVLDNWSEYITPAVDNGYYIIDYHGIIRVEERLGKDGDISEKCIDVCRSPFILCGISQPVNGTGTYYKLRFTTSKGCTKEAWVNHSDLITKKGINDQLVSLDINCPENGLQRETIEYVSRSIAEFSRFYKTEYSAAQCGWNEDKTIFVLGTRMITSDGVTDLLPIGIDSNFEELNKNGTLEAWMEATEPILSHDLARFKAYDAFTAPINYLLGVESHMCDHYGDTSTGKTLTSKIALSMVGKPGKGGLSYTADSTPKGLLIRVKEHSDLPILIDETSKAGESFATVVYAIANEMGRVKSTKDGKSDGGETYRSTVLVTGENSLRDSLTNAGQMLRVFELSEALPSIDAEIVRNAYSSIDENYGHIIELYMQKVFKMKDDGTLLKLYEDCYYKLPETKTNVEGRAKNIFAGIMTAGYILEKVFIDIGFSAKSPDQVVNKYFFQCVCEKPIEMEHIRALRIILDWTQSDYGSFTICNEQETLSEGNGFKRNGYIDEDYIDVIGTCLTDKLDKQHGMKTTKIKEHWARDGIIVPKTCKNWQFKRDGKTVNGIRIYRKKAEELLGYNDGFGGVTDVPFNNDVRLMMKTVSFLTEVRGQAEKSLINQTVNNIDTEYLLCMLVKNGKIMKVAEDTYKSF